MVVVSASRKSVIYSGLANLANNFHLVISKRRLLEFCFGNMAETDQVSET